MNESETLERNPHASDSHEGAFGERRTARHQESLVQLLSGLIIDGRTLITGELALARQEIVGSIEQAKTAVVSIAVGAAVLVAALGALVAAAILGLSLVVEAWLAALIIGVVLAVIGMVMMSAGKAKASPKAFVPERTIRAVQRDADAIRRNTL